MAQYNRQEIEAMRKQRRKEELILDGKAFISALLVTGSLAWLLSRPDYQTIQKNALAASVPQSKISSMNVEKWGDFNRDGNLDAIVDKDGIRSSFWGFKDEKGNYWLVPKNEYAKILGNGQYLQNLNALEENAMK